MLLLLPILFLARPFADDFCQMRVRAQYGITGGVSHWYDAWSGRYTSMFSQLFVNGFSPIAAFAIIAIWFVALNLLLRKILVFRGVPATVCTIGATIIIATMLAIAGDPYQSYFWTTGVLTYAAPLALITLALLIVDKSPALAALIVFFAAGFSDIGVLLMVIGFFVCFLWQRKFTLPLLAAIASFILVILAPGNAIRMSNFPAPNLLVALTAVSQYTVPMLTHGWPVLLALGILAFITSTKYDKQPISPLVPFFAIAGPLAWTLCIFTSGYYQSTWLTERAWVIPQYVTVASVCVCGYSLRCTLRLRLWKTLTAFSVLVISISTLAAFLNTYASARDYAAVYDSGHLLDVAPVWVKDCAASFYRVAHDQF